MGNKKKRRNLLVIGFLFITPLLLGCVNQSKSKQTIMLILDTQDSHYNQMIEEGVMAAISDYNDVSILKRRLKNTKESYQQNVYVQEAIDLGVDTIIFSAINIEKSKKDLEFIQKKGIRVIMMDSFFENPYNFNYIGTNNKEAGELVGKTLVELIGSEAEVGVLSFEDESLSSQEKEKEKAFYRFIEEFSRIKIIEKKLTRSDNETVQLLTEEMLTNNPEMDGIIAFNEYTTIGAGRAVKNKKMQNKVAVIGFDSQIECVELLENGSILALIVQNPFAIGYLSIQSAFNPSNDEKINKPIFTEVELVTQKTMYQSKKERLLFPFSYQD